jgi:Bacterial Ig-like domain (group 3)
MNQGMRTIGWCMLFLGMVAGAAAAESKATQTTLVVAINDAGPRTRATLTAHVSGQLTGSPSGVVTFRSEALDLGSALLDGEGNASIQTDVFTPGTHPVVATYRGQSDYLTSASQPEQVHAKASTVAGFTMSASPTSLSTTVGGFVDAAVTVTPVNGFSAYVSLSCNGLPVNTTCTFTPLNVPAICTTSASGVQTCTPAISAMQIQTLAPSPSTTARKSDDAGMRRYVFVFPALFGLVGLGACKRRPWRNLALGILAFAGALAITACAQRYNYLNHGPPGNPGTPAGTYTVVVEGQSSTGSETTTPPSLPQLTLTITAPKT